MSDRPAPSPAPAPAHRSGGSRGRRLRFPTSALVVSAVLSAAFAGGVAANASATAPPCPANLRIHHRPSQLGPPTMPHGHCRLHYLSGARGPGLTCGSRGRLYNV